MHEMICRLGRPVLAVLVVVLLQQNSLAQLYINEIFFDPPGDVWDTTHEYVELRGPADMMLDNHYLIFLEAEFNSQGNPTISGPPGEVEFIFDLSGRSLSPTGFLSFRQKGSPYTNLPNDEFHLINSGSGASWGMTPADNTLGVSSTSGVLENSGWTALLIRNDSGPVPTLGMMLDGSVDNDGNPNTLIDGLDHPNGREGWQIIDSIGIFAEKTEAVFGRTYSPLTFGYEADGENVFYIEESTVTLINQTFHPNIVDGQTYVSTGYEIELVARWGNSTGSGPGDWHISNITNEPGSGYLGTPGMPDFRQSCIDGTGCHPTNDGNPNTPAPQPPTGTESNHGVPYGTKLIDNIGKPNFILGDFNKDGVVDAGDYVRWRNTLGQTGNESNHPAADPNHDFVVDAADYAIWKAHYGEPNGSFPGGGGLSAGGLPTPEPAIGTMIAVAGAVGCAVRRRR